MKKIIIGLSVGFVAGAAVTYLLVHNDSVSPHQPLFTETKPIQDVPKISAVAAETHRRDAYAEIETIEDTLALPTNFAQMEALYTLAGRSDALAVQDLIYRTNQIADPLDRRAGLKILFSRLTELDPPSALALSRTGEYSANKQLEAIVWAEWGKNDIHNALIAAADLESDAQRSLAAQAMYSAYGAGGNETIALIEDALRVPPSRNTKAQYLYSQAAESPTQAIAYVEGQTLREQHTLTYWLADYLGRTNPENARQYAELFTSKRNQEIYLSGVTAAVSESSPESIMQSAFLAGGDQRKRARAVQALTQLASRDPDKAIAYMNQATSSQERQIFASAIVQGLAQVDPDRAMQWALEQDRDGRQHLYVNVLATIAHTDPQRALDAANAIQNAGLRGQTLQGVLTTVAHTDPLLAISYLDQIDNKQIGQSVAHSVVSTWARADPRSAIEWVLTRNGPDQRRLLSQVGAYVVHQDTQEAIRLLPRLDDQTAREWRLQIVSALASQGATAEVQSFVARHKGHEDYNTMFATTVSVVANNDYQSALQMAHSLPDGREKDGVWTSLAQQQVQVSPAESVRLVSLMSNEEQRLSSTSQIVRQWHGLDPEAAASWAQNLPRGRQRDYAIVGLADAWDELTPSRKILLKSVGDVEKRQQAQLSFVYKLARTNPATAERLALEFDFSDQYRQHLEQAIQQSQLHHRVD